MPAYLFLWNPKQNPDSFRGFERVLKRAASGTPYQTNWVCPSWHPENGDRAYMQRTGRTNNGIFARGTVIAAVHENSDGTKVARLRLDSFLPLGRELSRSTILERAEYDKPWSPMASGNVIPEEIVVAIESLWSAADPAQEDNEIFTASIADSTLFGLEGSVQRRLINHYKRERRLREAKLQETLRAKGHLRCEVPGCGFDFERVYGKLGTGYAEVHHLRPLSAHVAERETHLSDLAVVCANCHAMIHRNGECRDLSSVIRKG
jgi:predicted HNH restriction endonuclease